MCLSVALKPRFAVATDIQPTGENLGNSSAPSMIAERGAAVVLKEMALIAMNLASLNPVTEEVESDSEIVCAFRVASKPRSLFDREVAEIERMVRGRRKCTGLVHDDWAEWLNDLEANGATVEELDDAFRHVEALD